MTEPYPSYFGFEDLEVYQLSLEFITEVYRLTQSFPRSEQFGLSHQLQRAATSIALNIAEGRGRNSDKDFVRFLGLARGSLFEVVSGLQVAVRLGYATEGDINAFLAKASRIKGKLNALARALDSA